jgi:hypothetical protein
LRGITYQKHRLADGQSDLELETSYTIPLPILRLLRLVPDFAWRFTLDLMFKMADDPLKITGLSVRKSLRAMCEICDEVIQSSRPGQTDLTALQYEGETERITVLIR